MIIDSQLLFSNAQAVTAAAASTNYVDLSEVRDIGSGEDLYVVSVVTVAMTDGSSDSTLDVILYGDSSTSFTPDGQQSLFVFPAVSAIGTLRCAKLSPTLAPLQYRYIELYYSPANGNLSAGSFTSFLGVGVQNYVSYADAITIS
jgi:hypothetical protein